MVPFLDLKSQYRSIRTDIDEAIARVLESSQFVLGSAVEGFERDFASYCGTRHAVAVNSGTSALHLALLAAGIGPGDDVVTTPMTFVASIAAILYTGARAVLVDIDPATHNMNPDRIEAALTPRTKAIMPVHLHGRTAEMDFITDVANKHGLIVIEDAAQAHGACYRDLKAGSMGAMGCFSFYPGKNLGAYGEGGAVVTDRDDYASTLRTLRDWGMTRKYHHVMKGFNYRMDGIQGAILGVKLRHLDTWNQSRRNHAARYDALLAPRGVVCPPVQKHGHHVYHVYAVRIAQRDRVQKIMQERGIATNIHYPCPVHLQPAYADLGYGPGAFPESEAAGREFLSLPMFPELTESQIDAVCDVMMAS
ncbi:MAG TPA: DegT/DnrJ/EryC1/StrS family aminotransferase, partial [Magnetococcales bacterium]|nr:DegT/DnrJ/EryC1/StrS family aminotransferase [Magnetococcales bacterium]